MDISTGKEYGQEEPQPFNAGGYWMTTGYWLMVVPSAAKFQSLMHTVHSCIMLHMLLENVPTCSSTHYRLQTLAITSDIDATS